MHVQTLLTDLIGLSQFFFFFFFFSHSLAYLSGKTHRGLQRGQDRPSPSPSSSSSSSLSPSCRARAASLSLSLSLLLLHLQLHHAFSLLFFDSFQFLLERENQRITWRFMIFILSSSYFESLERLRYSSCCNLSFFSFSEKHAG